MLLLQKHSLTPNPRRAKRPPQVDDHAQTPHRQADRSRGRLHARLHLFRPRPAKVCLAWDACHRRRGIQLVRQPRHVDEPLALQLFDPDRVDVAPGSNVVREDHEVDRRGLCHSLHRYANLALRIPLAFLNLPVAQWRSEGVANPRHLRSSGGIHMADTKTFVVNAPSWIDLSTSDPTAARDYYSKLFGWKAEPEKDPAAGGYAGARAGGQGVARNGGLPGPRRPFPRAD